VAAGVDPQEREFPSFFLSYAHAPTTNPADQSDPDYWVRRFHENLCSEIERLAKLPRGRETVFIDSRLRLGQHWPHELARRLAHCAVFLPLYTTRYFRRPDCGREWQIIRQREAMHISSSDNSPDFVIPVLWQPVRSDDMPLWVRSIQHNDHSLSPAYQAKGLESLLRLHNYQADYVKAVHAIAKRILEVSRGPEQLRPLHEIPRFQSLPDAFAEEGHPMGAYGTVRITVAALDERSSQALDRSSRWYGQTAEDWCPYQDGDEREDHRVPAARRAADVARRWEFETEITMLSEDSEELEPKSGAAPSAPSLVLVDAWATLDDRLRDLLTRLDAAIRHKPWVRVILPLNLGDPETAARMPELLSGVRGTLQRSLSEARATSRRDAPRPKNSGAFGLAVSDTLWIAQSEFLRKTKERPPAPHKPRLLRTTGPE
jgi:FxsC-like protein